MKRASDAANACPGARQIRIAEADLPEMVNILLAVQPDKVVAPMFAPLGLSLPRRGCSCLHVDTAPACS